MSSESVGSRFRARWNARTTTEAIGKSLASMIPAYSKAKLPIDVEAAAKHVGITQVIEENISGVDGLLTVTPGGHYVAKIRSGQPTSRRRFTLAHEVGHAIVFASLSDSAKLDARRTLSAQHEHRDEERLCDSIAAELLMPSERVRSEIRSRGVSASSLPALAKRFGVSLQSFCRRATDIVPYDLVMSSWRLDACQSLFLPEWYVGRKAQTRVETFVRLGESNARCFAEQPVRGWYWFPLFGVTDNYCMNVAPLPGRVDRWLMLVALSNAAEHILRSLSTPSTENQPRQSQLL